MSHTTLIARASAHGLLASLAVSVSLGVLATAAAQTSTGAPTGPTAAPSSSGDSQNTVQEVVVTAQKRTQNLQDTPVTVTVAGAQLLQDANVRDIKDLTVLTPGLIVTSTTSEVISVARIRGVGTVGNNVGLESSVGIQVDGVYRPRNGVGFGDLGELSQVEVLKGPQGTLFGKNTDAGLINIITAAPSYKFGANAEFTAGNYGEVGGSASVTGPIIADKVAGSLFFSQRSRDGFYDVSTGAGPRQQTTDQDRNFYTIRGQLVADPSDDLHVRFIADYTRRSEHCCVAVQELNGPVTPALAALGVPGGAVLNPPNPYQRQAFINRPTNQGIQDGGVSLQVDYKAPGLAGAKITSITAYRDFVFTNGEDSDYTAADLLYRPANGDSGTGFKQFSEELRLGGTYGKLDYDVGGFFANEKLNSRVSELFGANFPQYLDILLSGGNPAVGAALQPLANLDGNGLGQKDVYNQNDQTYAFFTQETYRITSKLEFTGGIRYTNDTKDLTASYSNSDGGKSCSASLGLVPLIGVAASYPLVTTLCNALFDPAFDTASNKQSRSEDAVTGTAKLSYRFSPQYFAFFSYSRGYKSGGYNLDRIANPYSAPGLPGATPTSIAQSLQPALNTSFPGEFADAYELGLKTTLLDRKLDLNGSIFHQQYTGFQLNAYNGLYYTVVSVPDVSSTGFDIDALYRPMRSLTLQGGLTYANTRFPYSDVPALGGQDKNGAPLNPAFAATYRLPGQRLPEAPLVSLSASATYEHPIYNDLVGRGNLDIKYNTDANTNSTGNQLQVQKAYSIVDARVGVGPSDKRWSLEFFVQNLFDTHYAEGIFDSPFQSGSQSAFLGQPRTFGGTVRVRY